MAKKGGFMNVEKKRNRVPIHITIDREFLRKIENFANQKKISLSGAIHLILTDYFEKIERKKGGL